MDDEGELLCGEDGVQPGVEVLAVVDEAVGAVAGLAGVAHADQVGGEAASEGRDVRNDVAPEVGGGGVAVEEDDRLGRVAVAGVDVGHLAVEDADRVTLVGIAGGDVRFGHGCALSVLRRNAG